MEQLSELLNIGKFEPIKVKPMVSQTVGDIIQELDLKVGYFGVLINGKKAKMEDIVSQVDELVILPKISGG